MRCKLSEIALVSAGQGAPQGDSSYCESGTPFVKAGNLQELSNGASIDAIQKVSNEVAATHGLKLQRKGSVLFAKSGMSCLKGYVYVLPEDAYIVSHLACVTPMGVDSDYLCYYFRFHRPNKLVKDAAYPSISLADIGCLEIEIPEGNEVTQIVDALKRVESIINLHCQRLTVLDTLIKARFVEMFGTFPTNEKGWKTGTIRDLVTDVRYGSCRKAADGDSGQYSYLRMNNITYEGELDISDIKTIDIPDEELPKCTVRRGDVLFNRTNSKELVGKTCVYNRDEMMVLAGFVIRVRLNGRMLPEMLSAFLNTSFSKQMLLGLCKAAIGQANINAQEMQNIGIYIPPIECQKEFVDFKAQADKSKAVVQAAHVIARNLHSRRQQKCRILNF